MQRQHYFCTVEGCGREHKARGYCQTHYMQVKRGSPVTPKIKTRDRNPPPECTVEGCSSPVQARGLCKKHYARKLRHGHTKNRPRKKPFRVCSVGLCDRRVYSRDMCHAHYMFNKNWASLGLTAEQYEFRAAAQGYKCEICKQPETTMDRGTGKPRALSVDHCHKRGVIRGILCDPCNRGLGYFKDDPDVLGAARTYLLKYRQPG